MGSNRWLEHHARVDIHWFWKNACTQKNHDELKGEKGEPILESSVYFHRLNLIFSEHRLPIREKPHDSNFRKPI